jgi:hypothetical protein
MQGAFSAANGDVYLGEFFRGKFHGRGMLHFHDGAFYKVFTLYLASSCYYMCVPMLLQYSSLRPHTLVA